MSRRLRQVYGAGPLHLLALIASLLIAGAAVAGWFHNQGSITERILIWFIGAIVGHDLVLLPLYSVLDRVASSASRRPLAAPAAASAAPAAAPAAALAAPAAALAAPAAAPAAPAAASVPVRSPGWVYVRIPALLSGLLALVFFPEILRLGNQTFHTASGMTQDVYVSRFLLTCGVLFAGSALAYAVSLARAARPAPPAAPSPPTQPVNRDSPAPPSPPTQPVNRDSPGL
jgi:hypothetical protein